MGRSVRDAGDQVAGTAAEQAREVVSGTGRQARDLVGEARKQAFAQQHRAAEQLRTLAGELHDMAARGGQAGIAARGGQAGMAAEIAQEASARIHGVASWLEQREAAHARAAIDTPGVLRLNQATRLHRPSEASNYITNSA